MYKNRYYIQALLMAILITACSSERSIRKGDSYAAVMEYHEAAKEYRKAYRKIATKERKKRAEVAWKMGECYRKTNSPVLATGAYSNAVRYGYPDSTALLYLANAQLGKGDFKAAQKSYESYLEKDAGNRMAQIGLKSAQQSADWKKNPTRYIVKKAKELNGQRSDYCPAYVGEDTTMVITTSTRKEATGSDLSGITGQKHADLFITKKDEKGKWQKTEKIESDVNSEFEVLCSFLDKLPGVLKPGGRVAVLTFHSGEDRLVKKAFKQGKKDGIYSEVAEEVIRPSAEECFRNPRAKSTKMRWAIKE